MPLIRFVTAQDLFDAFPTAQQDVDSKPSDAPSLEYLRSLAESGEFNKAVAFCAYLLPRREAVGWGCRCVKNLLPNLPPEEQPGLQAADAWVRRPDEEQRLAALELGMRSNAQSPTTWLALAAGWSGGNIVLGIEATSMAPPQQTARAVRAAVLTAVSRLAPAEREKGLRACIEDGAQIAAEG
jgi:hypothetical protein